MMLTFTFVQTPINRLRCSWMCRMEDLIEALFIVLIISVVIQFGTYWIVYRRIAFYTNKKTAQATDPVSVIICARNESIMLRKNLASILEQDYPSFEVIVVDDCSWDETGLYLEEMSKQYSNLKIVTIKEQEKYRHGKKFALTLGIKAAKNEILILTDADCQAAGKQWLSLMQRNYTEGKEIVLGYGAYRKSSGLVNTLIRFDALHIAMQYFSAALGGKAYMGVGRNLSYKRTIFFRSKGFAKHNHILSGDDDLFINENATSSNTAIETDPGSFTYSDSKKTFSAWLLQKTRHMSTARYYKSSQKFSLGLRGMSLFVFYATLIALFTLQYEWRILVSLYAFMLLSRFPIFYRVSSRLKEKDLAWAFPFLEIIHSILQPVFYTANLLTKQKTWK